MRSFLALAGASLLAAQGELAAQGGSAAFRWPDGKRVAVSLSFDDARTSQMDTGVALFDHYGVKVTFFVNPKNLEPRLEAWKKTAAKGHEIGNHSRSHPCTGNFAWSRSNALESYTTAMIETEMDGANADIERMLGVKPTTFAYPCGEKFIGRGTQTLSYVPMVAKRFRAARGFRDEAANDPAFCDLAQLLGIDSDGMTFEEMKQAVLAGANTGGWVVFAGHEIGSAGQQTTQTASLEKLLEFAKDPANGVWLETVDTVARYVEGHRTVPKR